MNWLDIILIFSLAGFVWRGFFAGLIKSVGSFLGLIIGAIAASQLYLRLFESIKPIFGGMDNVGKLVSFIIILVVASRVIYWIFVALDKTYNLLSIIPFLKSINRLAGALLGLIIGSLLLGLLLLVISKYFPAGSFIGRWFSDSKIAPYLLVLAKIFLPILSGSLKNLKSLI